MAVHSRSRKRLQYSLRGALALLTLVCAELGYRVNLVHRQRRAVESILESGGAAFYEFEESDPWRGPQHPPAPRSRLRQWLGRDYFERVVEVRYPAIERDGYGSHSARPTTDGAAFVLRALQDLPDLQRLELHDDAIVDADLKSLATLGSLERLTLSGAKLGNDATTHLARLRRLRSLSLQAASIAGEAVRQGRSDSGSVGTPVQSELDDKGIERLASLTQLEELSLGGSGITDAALITIGRLRGMKNLSLQRTSATREGMNALRRKLPKTWTAY